MASVRLRPNATIASSVDGVSIILVGAAAYHTALSDSSDASYARSIGSGGGGSVLVGFDDLTLPVLAQVRSVQASIRHNNITGGLTRTEAFMSLQDTSNNGLITRYQPASTGTIVTSASTLRTTNLYTGAAWTDADIDNIRGYFQGYCEPSSGETRIYEAYIDVIYNEAPVCVVTGPVEGSTLTDTSQPTVTWTYTDPESDIQERYQIQITNTGNTVTYWDSLEVLSAATSRQIGIALANGTYLARVRVVDVNSTGRYSNWDTNTFTLNVAPPPVPTITATWDATLHRVAIAITQGGPTPVTESYYGQYQDAGDVTWTALRSANPVVWTASPMSVYDNEAKPGVTRTYRVAAARVVSGQPFISAYSSTASAAIPAATEWWLADPTGAIAGLHLDFHDAVLVMARPENQAVFRPLGRTRVVVQAGTITGEEGDLSLSFRDNTSFVALEALRGTQRTLWLTTPYGLAIYVRLGATRSASLLLGGGSKLTPKRTVTLSFVEVDRPA